MFRYPPVVDKIIESAIERSNEKIGSYEWWLDTKKELIIGFNGVVGTINKTDNTIEYLTCKGRKGIMNIIDRREE